MGNKQSNSNPLDLGELKDQTKLNEENIAEYHDEFLQRYPKGRITKDEMKKEFKRLFPAGDPQPFATRLFSVYDKNRDGTIDFREFICGIGLMRRGSLDQKLQIAFRMYDLDNDGFITESEMQSVVAAIYKTIAPIADKKTNAIATDAAQAMFKRMDKNRDNKVTFQEFAAGVKKDPDILRLLEAVMK